jgi:hypothetical protein
MLSHTCSICGREDKLYEKGSCERCSLARRTAQLMAGPDETAAAALAGLADTIVASATPRKALNWLRQGAGAPILAQLSAGTMAISHEALDAHPQPRAANHIRQMLIAHGALPARDEQLATLERLNSTTVAGIERPEDRNTVAAFATWRVLRSLRRRAEHNTAKRTAINHARNQVLAAVAFLDWLAAHHLTLATASQGDLELWLATGAPSRYDVRPFIDWTSQRKLSAKMSVPPLRSRPGDALDAETRWAIISQLLRGPDIELADRVAGCFVLIYAQPLSRVAMMTVDQITRTDTGTSVCFGTQAINVPDPLAGLVSQLAASGRSHHIGIGSTPTSWLFPGHLPGRPLTALRLGQRLSPYGIDARAARRAAQTQLAAQVPAVVLAEMLGVTIRTAVDWVHSAGGDWANYAATTANSLQD